MRSAMRIAVPEDLSLAKYALETFLIRGEFDLYEDHTQLGTISSGQSAVEISYGKVILACWAEGWSRSWRVVAYEVASDRARLECTKRMGLDRSVVELVRADSEQTEEFTRGQFAVRLAAAIEKTIPGMKIASAVAARNDRKHISGVYSRILLHDGATAVAVVGVSRSESQANVDAILGAGLIWLETLDTDKSSGRLILVVPKGQSLTIATRLTGLEVRGARLSLFEFDESSGRLEVVTPFDQGDLAERLRRAALNARWPRVSSISVAAADKVDAISALGGEAVERHFRDGWVTLAIRGLEFARVSIRNGQVFFGAGRPKQRLGSRNWSDVERLACRTLERRTADYSDHDDPFFRLQSERWLESLIRADPSVIDPTLDSKFCYSQVPTYRGEERGLIDLLGITRSGRLAVIELKLDEDPEFPFQGLDYWLRVEWHRARGDFKKRGCFPGIEIANTPPLLYLVAPVFRFHGSTRLLAGAIASRIPTYRIGINDGWRSEIRVLMRERLN